MCVPFYLEGAKAQAPLDLTLCCTEEIVPRHIRSWLVFGRVPQQCPPRNRCISHQYAMPQKATLFSRAEYPVLGTLIVQVEANTRLLNLLIPGTWEALVEKAEKSRHVRLFTIFGFEPKDTPFVGINLCSLLRQLLGIYCVFSAKIFFLPAFFFWCVVIQGKWTQQTFWAAFTFFLVFRLKILLLFLGGALLDFLVFFLSRRKNKTPT